PIIGASSSDAENLVRLEAQPPTRVLLTVSDGRARIVSQRGTIHGLQKKLVECQILETLRLRPFLWIDKLQLISVYKRQIGACLRTHTNPINAPWWKPRAVGLDRDLKPERVESRDQTFIELQQRLSAGADNETIGILALCGPAALNDVGQFFWAGKTSAVRRDPDEVRIEKRAHGGRAILLAPRPEIASGKATEDGGPSRMKSLALKGEENLLDRVVRHMAPGPSLPRQQKPRAAIDMHHSDRSP